MTDEIEYVSADKEEGAIIATATVQLDKKREDCAGARSCTAIR